VDLPACGVTRVGDDQLLLRLRLAPPGYWRDAAHSVSYAQALDPAQLAEGRMANRIVLVGLGASGPPDNPDVHVIRDGLGARTVYGVELQADAIATLAGGRVPQLPTADQQLLSTLLMCLLGGSVAVAGFDRPAWQRRLALLGIALVWLALAWWLARRSIVLGAVTDIAVLCLSALALRALQVMAKRRQAFRRIAT
jgi:CHASE2 domain-containing sensor protein